MTILSPQDGLENLNAATNSINHLEAELDVSIMLMLDAHADFLVVIDRL